MSDELEQLQRRVLELERGGRPELDGLARAIGVEREITRNLIDALNVRLDASDMVQAETLQALKDIRRALGMNGSGGHHG